MTIMIFDGSVELTDKTPIVSFSVEGKRVKRERLNKMFASAAKQLNVSEDKLVYDRFD